MVKRQDQLLRGTNHWLERIPTRNMLVWFALTGIALGDVNGDGLEDVYLCQDPGVPNRLFLQNPDGTLRDVSEGWGVNWLEESRSALLVDLDNDGDQDLAVAIFGSLLLASNENQHRFRIQTVLPTSESTSSLFAVDFDHDGRLDLYVCGYAMDQALDKTGRNTVGAASSNSYVDANDGSANKLFRNDTTDTQWRFRDVTQQVGLDYPDDGRAVAVVDWDHDGDLDLWISNRNAPRLRLMLNNTPVENHWVALQLVGNGKTTNRDAIGARVELILKNPKSEIRNRSRLSAPVKALRPNRASGCILDWATTTKSKKSPYGGPLPTVRWATAGRRQSFTRHARRAVDTIGTAARAVHRPRAGGSHGRHPRSAHSFFLCPAPGKAKANR